MFLQADRRGFPGRRSAVRPVAAGSLFVIQISSHGLEDAAEIASWMNSSNVFWSVLAVLLAGGCVYYLFNWLYVQRVRLHQEKMRALYTLAEGLIPSDQPGAVLRQIAEVVPFVADATHCSIWILDPASHKLDFSAGTDKSTTSSLSMSAIAGAVTCFRNQAITDVPDAEDCPFVNKETVRRLRQKALLYVPIMADRTCLGVIEVEDRRRKRIFTAEQKAQVEHVGKLAALGLWQRAQSSLQDQVHRAEKMTAMGEFIEGVGEELVGPLASILSVAQQPGENGEEVPSSQKEIIIRDARRASEALSRLVKFVRPRHTKQDKVNMNDLLEKVVESFRANWKNKGLRFQLELSKAAPEITGDAAHLEEILVNVFRNAERFVESLGRQVLEVYTDVLERDVLISITPGGGPSSTASETLPDPERTEGPSGLGLSVCRSLIEGAGGSLRVDRGTHRGFCIEIEYPLARETWSATPAAPVQSRNTNTRRTGAPAMVLLIDDDVATQDKLLHYLTDRGHRTVLAASVEEGIDLAERGRFHWVMCKIQMGRMSGLELYNRLHKQDEKFVFLADEKVIVYNEELFSGKDRYILHKPLRTADVERVIDGLEGRAVPTDESQATQV